MKAKSIIFDLLALSLFWFCSVCQGGSNQSQSDAVGIVLDILKSDDQQMQSVAISMINEMKGEEVTKALAAELPNLSVTSQVQLLAALGNRGDAAALPAVVDTVKSGDESVRIAALNTLGQLGDVSCIDLLAKTAANSSRQERKAARESLYQLRGSDIDKAILKKIPKETDSKVKIELLDCIGERNILEGVDVLFETVKDSDRNVRVESLKVLRTVTGPDKLPVLIDLLINAQSSSERNEAQKTLVAVAGKIEDVHARDNTILAVLPTVKDIQARCSLLSVLGELGVESSLSVLTSSLNDENEQVQAAAIRALSNWPNPRPLNDLLKVAESSGNELHRTLALRGFIHLLGLENERSDQGTILMYERAMNLAAGDTEKKKVLSALAQVKSLEALEMSKMYLGNEKLSSEAEFAVIKIAENVYEQFPQQVKNTLNQLLKQLKNDSLRKQTEELIHKIDNSGEQQNEKS